MEEGAGAHFRAPLWVERAKSRGGARVGPEFWSVCAPVLFAGLLRARGRARGLPPVREGGRAIAADFSAERSARVPWNLLAAWRGGQVGMGPVPTRQGPPRAAGGILRIVLQARAWGAGPDGPPPHMAEGGPRTGAPRPGDAVFPSGVSRFPVAPGERPAGAVARPGPPPGGEVLMGRLATGWFRRRKDA